MATIYQISPSDTATEMAGKVNQSMSNLKYAVEHSEGGSGEGGGGSTSNDVISRNTDAVNRIQSAKKHFDDRTLASGSWSTNTHQTCFCIGHISDLHSDVTRYTNFRNFCEGVDMIDAAIVTGDLTDYGTGQMPSMKTISDGFERIDILQVIGNHDRWGSGSTSADAAAGLGMPSSATGGYYYKDFADKKIRIIVLNEYDTANVASGTTHTNVNYDGVFSQEQITWLFGVLDDAITNEYNVIIARHGQEKACRPTSNDKGFYQRSNPWQNNYTYIISGTIIEDIVAAFRSGGTINQTYSYSKGDNPSVTVNHNFASAGNFIAYLTGHVHIDNIGFSPTHGDQLYLTVPSGCYYFSGNGRTVQGASVSDLPRFENKKSEDCFNVYAIDTINKLVKVVRVGADVNDLMEKREMAYYNYQPSNS